MICEFDYLFIVIRLPAGYNGDDDNVSTGSCDHQWETKSRFTEYSITSSVLPRSEGICHMVYPLLTPKLMVDKMCR